MDAILWIYMVLSAMGYNVLLGIIHHIHNQVWKLRLVCFCCFNILKGTVNCCFVWGGWRRNVAQISFDLKIVLLWKCYHLLLPYKAIDHICWNLIITDRILHHKKNKAQIRRYYFFKCTLLLCVLLSLVFFLWSLKTHIHSDCIKVSIRFAMQIPCA